MEYCDGGDLAGYIQVHCPITEADAMHIALSVLDALIYIHAKGLMHCNMKPANILLLFDSWVKLSDFSLSKDTGVCSSLCSSGSTYTYVLPELFSRLRLDSAADLWSLGITLVEMACSEPPSDAT